MITEEKKDILLKARSVKLAQIEEKAVKRVDGLNVVLFLLSGELYAVESQFVDEVFPIKEITALPAVPNFVLGVIQVRRKVYSVVDLRHLLGIPAKQNEENSRAIILKSPATAFGLLANEVLGMRTIANEELQPALPSMHGIYLEFIKGITPDRVVVLDGERILSTSTLIVSQS